MVQEISFQATRCTVVRSNGDTVIFHSTEEFDARVHGDYAEFNRGAAPSLKTARGQGVVAARAMGWMGPIELVNDGLSVTIPQRAEKTEK